MRVLMFGWEFPPHQAGGLATATVGLVKGLLRRGVAVTLVVPFPVGESPIAGLRLLSGAGWPVASGPGPANAVPEAGLSPPGTGPALRRLRVPTPVLPYGGRADYARAVARLGADAGPPPAGGAPGGPPNGAPSVGLGEARAASPAAGAGSAPTGVYGGDLFGEVDRLAAVAGAIAAEEPHDVLHVHDWITYRAGIEARRAAGRPLVAHIHATEPDRSGEHADPEIERREREGLLAADLVIANSRALRRTVVDRYGVPARRVAVVHWGIDDGAGPDVAGQGRASTGPGGPPPGPGGRATRRGVGGPDPFGAGRPVVLFLGRVTRQKGPDLFLEMARRVAARVPEARFVVAGGGDLLPWMTERAAELGLADRVAFAGPLAGEDVERAYRLARVCVMPSRSEPFGLVALESVRSGTPCIVPRASGVAEVLGNALRADPADPEELADKVVAVLRHPELRAELGERAAGEVAGPRFALEEAARRVEEAYRAALADRGGPAASRVRAGGPA